MNSEIIYKRWSDVCEELLLHKDSIYLVIDSKVRIHLPAWIQTFEKVYWVLDPEREKNLKSLELIAEAFVKSGISRSSKVIAIGGGATTDLAGFAAATIMRGVHWISIPTTLLAMVDGSLGGKVAVNIPLGKNLLGAFHAPDKVYICEEFLNSLSVLETQSGKGEILKYGFLSLDIREMILNQEKLDLISMACAKYKKEITDRDFREKGDRIFLNLGHTLGHAFESTLRIPHGLAVAMGINYIFKIFELHGLLAEWKKLALSLGLPIEKLQVQAYSQFSLTKLLNAMRADKKKDGQDIQIVLLKDMGEPFVCRLDLEQFLKKVEEYDEFKS